jgi:Na+-transporting NADH:ubiquinone oxidoreductase subunit NqrB
LTYLIQRDDVVWALVRGQSHPRLLERLFFGAATLLIGVSSAIRTWARACPERAVIGRESSFSRESRCDGPYRYVSYPLQIGNLLFSLGLGFLAPAVGFVLLVTGESVVCFRLIRREQELKHAESSQRFGPDSTQTLLSQRPLLGMGASWGRAFREESAKWGLFVTMIVFTLLLRDRVAEVLAMLSFLIWVLLNWNSFLASAEGYDRN